MSTFYFVLLMFCACLLCRSVLTMQSITFKMGREGDNIRRAILVLTALGSLHGAGETTVRALVLISVPAALVLCKPES